MKKCKNCGETTPWAKGICRPKCGLPKPKNLKLLPEDSKPVGNTFHSEIVEVRAKARANGRTYFNDQSQRTCGGAIIMYNTLHNCACGCGREVSHKGEFHVECYHKELKKELNIPLDRKYGNSFFEEC